jgi:release factor glutamine methyltransferase
MATIQELLKKGEKILNKGSKSALLDSEILLASVLGKNKAYLYANRYVVVTKMKQRKFEVLIEKRKGKTPVAYLTNSKEFYGVDYYVDENVLIPRPETEGLVELSYGHIVILLRKNIKLINVIDVGTGSGCIGISLIRRILDEALNKKANFAFYLTDVSRKALKIARRNFERLIGRQNHIKVHFAKIDLLKGLKANFDIIVSNPPYIPTEQIDSLDPGVKDFEPRVALDGGKGGTKIVFQLISSSVNQLKKEGVLLFEMHEEHPDEVENFISENFPELRMKLFKDDFGILRFARIMEVDEKRMETDANL